MGNIRRPRSVSNQPFGDEIEASWSTVTYRHAYTGYRATQSRIGPVIHRSEQPMSGLNLVIRRPRIAVENCTFVPTARLTAKSGTSLTNTLEDAKVSVGTVNLSMPKLSEPPGPGPRMAGTEKLVTV